MSIGILGQMIHDHAKIGLFQRYDKHSVRLEETQQRDSAVEIRGLPANAVVVKMDSFPAPSGFFTGIKGECKRADYAIFAEVAGKKRVVFIEMKRGSAREQEIIKQFKGALCVLMFCKEIAKQFYDCKDFLKDFEFRYVSFKHTSITKTGSRKVIDSTPPHSRPECMMKINYSTFCYFNKLAGA
ncbi:MAG: hypothetical protein JW795_16735 [Chitinivibrionales bacterium]|nr:hypothetical protein [Chitinivibrionales bacterium]